MLQEEKTRQDETAAPWSLEEASDQNQMLPLAAWSLVLTLAALSLEARHKHQNLGAWYCRMGLEDLEVHLEGTHL